MLILFLLFEPYVFKIVYIGNMFNADDKYGYLSVLINDSQIIILCYVLYMLACSLNKCSFYVFRLLALIFYVLYILDIILIITFSTRLYVTDVLGMYDDMLLFFGDIGLVQVAMLMFVVLCTVVFMQNKDSTEKGTSNRRVLVVVLASTFCMGFFYDSNTSVRSVFFRNYVDINLRSTYSRPYSEQFISSFKYKPVNHCSQIKSIRPDSVYIFLVESWSNYHSDFFGLQNNWTPNLDKLAKENISLRQFYANGFTTEAGLFSLFTGRFPILYGQNMKLDGTVGLMQFMVSDSLPAEMAKLGYQPYFITSGDLNFLDKGQWLDKIGFSTIIGAADYSGKSQRYLFNSVSDAELFNRVEQVVHSDLRPKFVVIENVSTHAPFYSPGVNGEPVQSEKSAFLYTDKSLYELIKKIKGKNNLIIVMSDHRAMTTMTEEEREKSGMMAVSKVPAFIMWGDKKLSLEQPFQQTDMMNSIVGLMQGRQCAGDVKGGLFPVEQAISPRCIFHARGDSRELVTVKCNDGRDIFNIVLDGDQTRSQLETAESKLAVDIVNYTRIRQN